MTVETSRLESPLEGVDPLVRPVRAEIAVGDFARRSLVAGAVGVIILSVSVAFWSRHRAGDLDFSAFEPIELEALLGHEMVLRIGAEYRTQHRSQLDRQKLADLLRRTATGHGQSANPEASVSLSLRELAEADLRAGRIVLVDGWLLSETEARQCELSHLADR